MDIKKEIKNIIKKYNIKEEDFNKLLKESKIYVDYDEVLVELNEYSIKYINKKFNKNIKMKDITSWDYYFKNGLGDVFINEILKDEELYSKEKVKIKDKAKELIEELTSISDNVYIVTTSLNESMKSKNLQIAENFPKLKNNVIHMPDGMKFMLNYSNAILIDDAPHNVESVVHNNENGNAILIDRPFNQEVKTDKRIIRNKNYKDIKNQIIYLTLNNIERHLKKKQKIYFEDLPKSMIDIMDNHEKEKKLNNSNVEFN